eukprot:CAMPEP_0204641624 /NCGR_PEP_ID=MMETSP0717-20131115/51241_1 /ASSEMBLY_ACC=CAM_ASM_000666 /TAXON_ID=230516 /ORGANISM="Chaetoceros curvisetus" /LENGTH=115 /DNA_ID=CAMNT_0051662313 /DNA_START=373 /DNA_END=720 /DNA_ORIENTATION=-
MLLEDLEAVDFGGLWTEGVPLKEGIPHVRDENWPPAGHRRVFLTAAELKEIAQQRKPGLSVLEFGIRVDADTIALRSEEFGLTIMIVIVMKMTNMRPIDCDDDLEMMTMMMMGDE